MIAGPGNAWVREAKRPVYGRVGIDSLAGPSELMLVAGHDTDPEWAALDLCAQAEHGADSPLVAVAPSRRRCSTRLERGRRGCAAERPSVADAPLALVQAPDLEDAVDLANAFAPEHLELLEEDAALLAAGSAPPAASSSAATAPPPSATTSPAPTTCCRPAAPAASRARSAPAPSAAGSPRGDLAGEAAAALAPHVDALARAEGFPVHGESAMIAPRSRGR